MTALARSDAAPWLTLVGIGENGLDACLMRHGGPSGKPNSWSAATGTWPLAGPLEAETLPWWSPIEATFPAILARRPRPVCVLASGDPFCFGIGSTLARHVPPE